MVVPAPPASSVVASASPVIASSVVVSAHAVTRHSEGLFVQLLLGSPVGSVVAFAPLQRLAGYGVEEGFLLVAKWLDRLCEREL